MVELNLSDEKLVLEMWGVLVLVLVPVITLALACELVIGAITVEASLGWYVFKCIAWTLLFVVLTACPTPLL